MPKEIQNGYWVLILYQKMPKRYLANVRQLYPLFIFPWTNPGEACYQCYEGVLESEGIAWFVRSESSIVVEGDRV